MKYFTRSMTLLGKVSNFNPTGATFVICCRSGYNFQIQATSETWFSVLQNLDDLSRDCGATPQNVDPDGGSSEKVRKFIHPDTLVSVQGFYLEHKGKKLFEARSVTLMHFDKERYMIEETHWWLTQIGRLADEWLDDLFGYRRTYQMDDFAELYQTNLNISGLPVQDNRVQECATLSRLIYGLSSAYLLRGNERYLLAAKAGVKYQRDAFRSLRHDGEYCFWHYGKRKTRVRGAKTIVTLENGDDLGTVPPNEHIYALAGLAKYFRITQDWEVLENIRHKDFWQQEQEILAYPMLYGGTREARYLTLVREMATFWKAFFLDHDNRGDFFRVSDDYRPVIEGAYSHKGRNFIVGYHASELKLTLAISISMKTPPSLWRPTSPACGCAIASKRSTRRKSCGKPPPPGFIRRAMQNRRIIKAAPCHALLALTPSPGILAGRKVICNPVVLADVINASALYTPCPPGRLDAQQVVVDGDLVTTPSWHATEARRYRLEAER